MGHVYEDPIEFADAVLSLRAMIEEDYALALDVIANRLTREYLILFASVGYQNIELVKQAHTIAAMVLDNISEPELIEMLTAAVDSAIENTGRS